MNERQSRLPRTAVQVMGGETGDDRLAPAEWIVDLEEPEGHVVYGYMDTAVDDPPPMCHATTPRAP